MVFPFYKNPISKIVGGLYYFNLKIIKKPVINKYDVFYYENSSPSLFGGPIFFVYI